MSGGNAYALILAALPRHGDLFSAKRPPISRLGLERRLALLQEADRAEIDMLESLLSWDRQQRFADDRAALDHAEAALATLRSPLVRRLARERIAMRSAVAALRRRLSGGRAPEPRERWGLTPLSGRIARRWERPGFGLGPSEAWLARTDICLRTGDVFGAEREILQEVWRRLSRADAGLAPTFEAIAVYVMRWNVIDRWTKYDAETAQARFSAWSLALADAAIADAQP
jgi:hypothetical protein